MRKLKFKRFLSVVLVATLVGTTAVPAFAEDNVPDTTEVVEEQSEENTEEATSVEETEVAASEEAIYEEETAETESETETETESEAESETETETETETEVETEAEVPEETESVAYETSDLDEDVLSEMKEQIDEGHKIMKAMDITVADDTEFPVTLKIECEGVSDVDDVYILHGKHADEGYEYETISPDAVEDDMVEATFESLSPIAIVRALTEEEKAELEITKKEYEFTEATETATIGDLVVTVKGEIPVGATITITKADRAVLQSYAGEGELIMSALDITITDENGNKYEPVDYGKSLEVTFGGLDKSEAEEIKIVHLKGNTEYEELTDTIVTSEQDSVTVEMDNFSIVGTSTTKAIGSMTVEGNVNIPLLGKSGAIYHMCLTSGGETHEAFCIDLGKAASSGDTYIYNGKFNDAAIRKVLTAFYATNNGTDYTLSYTEAQALVWAAQAGYTSEANYREVLTSVGTADVMQNNIISAINSVSTPDELSVWNNAKGSPSDGYQRFITDFEVQTLHYETADISGDYLINIRIFKNFEPYTTGEVYLKTGGSNVEEEIVYPYAVNGDGVFTWRLEDFHPVFKSSHHHISYMLYVDGQFRELYAIGLGSGNSYYADTSYMTGSFDRNDDIFDPNFYKLFTSNIGESVDIDYSEYDYNWFDWYTASPSSKPYIADSHHKTLCAYAFVKDVEVYSENNVKLGTYNIGMYQNSPSRQGYYSSTTPGEEYSHTAYMLDSVMDDAGRKVSLSRTTDPENPSYSTATTPSTPIRYIGLTNAEKDSIKLFKDTWSEYTSLPTDLQYHGTNRLSETEKFYLVSKDGSTYDDSYCTIRLIYDNKNWTGQNFYVASDISGSNKVYPKKQDGYGVYYFKNQEITDSNSKYMFVNDVCIGQTMYLFRNTMSVPGRVPEVMTMEMSTSSWATDKPTQSIYTYGNIERRTIYFPDVSNSLGTGFVVFVAPLRIYSEDGSQLLEEKYGNLSGLLSTGSGGQGYYSSVSSFAVNNIYPEGHDIGVHPKYADRYIGYRDNLTDYLGTTHAPSMYENGKGNGRYDMRAIVDTFTCRLSQAKNVYVYNRYRTLVLDKGNADTGSNINVYYGSGYYKGSSDTTATEHALNGDNTFGFYLSEGADSLDHLYSRVMTGEENCDDKANPYNPMSDQNFSSVMPTKAGYVLKGYYTAPNGGGTKVLDVYYTKDAAKTPYLGAAGTGGDPLYNLSNAKGAYWGAMSNNTVQKLSLTNETTMLYAYFEEHTTKSVTYVDTFKTGGAVPTDTTEYEVNDTVTVKGRNTLVRTGWTFVGWSPVNTNYIHGTSPLYTQNDTFTITDNTTLYAIWKKTLPIVTVDYEGATGRPVREKYAINVDTPDRFITSIGGKDVATAGGNVIYSLSDINAVNASEFALTKQHHSYGGIYTARYGTGTQVVSSVPAYNEAYIATIDSDRTIYAKWTPNKYTVHFEPNGGSAVADKEVEYNTKIAKPVCTYPGHVLLGWFTDPGFTDEWKFDDYKVNGPLTLYAKWETTKYTVIFKNIDNTEIDRITNLEYGDTVTATATVPEYHDYKGKYTFIGKWGIKNGLAITIGTGPLVHNKVEVLTGSTAYVDAWNRMMNDATLVFYPCYETAVKYRYIWYDEDGTTELKNVTDDAYHANFATSNKPANPTKSGYTFDKWVDVKSLTDAYNEWKAAGEDPTQEIVVKFKASYKKNTPKSEPTPKPDDPEPDPDPTPGPKPPVDPTPTPPTKPTPPVKPTPGPKPDKPTPPVEPPVDPEEPADPVVPEIEEEVVIPKPVNPDLEVGVIENPEPEKPSVMRSVVAAIIAGTVAIALVATGALDYIWMLALLLLARKKRIKFHGVLTDLDNRFITFDGIGEESEELVQDVINRHDTLESFVEEMQSAKETTILPPYTKMTIAHADESGEMVTEVMEANEEKLWQELENLHGKVFINIHNSKAKFDLEFTTNFS